MKTILVVAALSLAACATPEQRADKLVASHGPTCDRLGFARDSDGWRNCVMQSDATAASKQAATAASFSAYSQIQRTFQPTQIRIVP